MASLGDIIAGIGDVKPDTLAALHERERLDISEKRAKSQEAYQRSQLGLMSARVAAAERLADRPQIYPPGAAGIRPGETKPFYVNPIAGPRPVIHVTNTGQAVVATPDKSSPSGWKIDVISPPGLLSTPKNIPYASPGGAREKWLSLAPGIQSGPWTDVEKLRRHMEAGASATDAKTYMETESPSKPTFTDEQIRKAMKGDAEAKRFLEEQAKHQGLITGERIGATIDTRFGKIDKLTATASQIADALAKSRRDSQEALFTPEVVNGMADYAFSTGNLPPLGLGPVGRAKFFGALREKVESSGGWGNYAARTQFIRSLQNSQTGLQNQRGKIDAFMLTNDKNLDLAVQISDAVERTDIPILNRLLINASTLFGVPLLSVSSPGDVAALNAALRIASNETARVLVSATGSGILSDSARAELRGMLDSEFTPQMVKKVANIFRMDMDNRRSSYAQEAQLIMDMVKEASPNVPTPPAPRAPIQGTSPLLQPVTPQERKSIIDSPKFKALPDGEPIMLRGRQIGIKKGNSIIQSPTTTTPPLPSTVEEDKEGNGEDLTIPRSTPSTSPPTTKPTSSSSKGGGGSIYTGSVFGNMNEDLMRLHKLRLVYSRKHSPQHPMLQLKGETPEEELVRRSINEGWSIFKFDAEAKKLVERGQ